MEVDMEGTGEAGEVAATVDTVVLEGAVNDS